MKSNLKVILPAIGVAALLVSPALAVVRHPTQTLPGSSFDACDAVAVERGAAPQQGGNASNPYIQYKAFVRDCLAGKIPLSPGAGPLGRAR